MDLRPVTEDDLAEAGTVFAESLGTDPVDGVGERSGRYWELDRTWVVEDERGRIAGVAASAASTMTLAGGGEVDGGAVPHVGVRQTAQGLGVGRYLLEHQLRTAAGAGEALLALNASEATIYGRFGYGPTSTSWDATLDARRTAWRDGAPQPGVVEELDGEAAEAAMREVFVRSWGRYPGEVRRWDGWWDVRLERGPWHRSRPRVVVHHDEDGRPDAAALHTISQQDDAHGFSTTLTVEDLVATDDRAYLSMLRWLCGRRLTGEVRLRGLDPATALPLALADPRQLRTTDVHEAVWVRVLDPAAVLGARTAAADGRVVVDVRDPLLPDVDGCWAVEADGGVISCERTDEAAGVAFDVDLLASLVWGFVGCGAAVAAGRAVAHDDVTAPVLDRMLAWHRPSWCATAF